MTTKIRLVTTVSLLIAAIVLSACGQSTVSKANPGNGFGHQGLRTVGAQADGSRGENGATVRANPLKNNIKTDADGADEVHPPQSVPENAGWSARL